MGFGLGSKASAVPASGFDLTDVGQPEPALSFTSWDDWGRDGDMCKGGGATAIILILLVVLIVGFQNWICYRSSKYDWKVPPHTPLWKFELDSGGHRIWSLHNFVAWLNAVFVMPFVPTRLDVMIMWIFDLWFAITIPMVVTRYYELRWSHDTFVLQGPLNLMSNAIGCGTLDMHAIPYTEKLEGLPATAGNMPTEKWERIDYNVAHHLTFGILWLVFGFVQIFNARDDGWSPDKKSNWQIHKWFGRISVVFLIIHISLMGWMTFENPMNQHNIILAGYVFMLWEASHSLYIAINHIRNGDKQMHKVYMFYTYVRSTMGSGSIRIAAWALWLVGHFLPPDIRMRLDRGDCQTFAKLGIGDATDCWAPVFINLLFTDFIVTWLEVTFLSMPENDPEKFKSDNKKGADNLTQERRRKKSKMENSVIAIAVAIPLVVADNHWDNTWFAPVGEFAAFIWFIMMKVDHLMHKIVDRLHEKSPVRSICRLPSQRFPKYEHVHDD